MYKLKTPVVFIIFNRPDTTQEVFARIRQAQPPSLLVIADGVRSDRPGEAEKVAQARAIIEQVDWDCQVIKNYSEINLGCAKRVSSGLDWAFEQVEEAIILEDDCVPHPTFFRYCQELLERYRHDDRIGSISGQNVQFGQSRSSYSYYYSIYSQCWGWATWRRAWTHYDLNMSLWPEFQASNSLQTLFSNPIAITAWERLLQNIYEHPTEITWDYQWLWTCWTQGFLTIISDVNLISNIGFGTDATHFATQQSSPYNNLPAIEMTFPLQHPTLRMQNKQADDFTQSTLFNYYGLRDQLKGKLQAVKRLLIKSS
jgi:hypothetical protein